jgi:hypothetical protein
MLSGEKLQASVELLPSDAVATPYNRNSHSIGFKAEPSGIN